MGLGFMQSRNHTPTHTHTRVCVCVCNSNKGLKRFENNFTPHFPWYNRNNIALKNFIY